jgi:hypothetical protein
MGMDGPPHRFIDTRATKIGKARTVSLFLNASYVGLEVAYSVGK